MSWTRRSINNFLVILVSCVLNIYGDSDLKPVHLGCYLSWEKNNLALENTFSKIIVERSRDSCSEWCAKQIQTIHHIILLRGNQCICSTWTQLHSKMPDFVRVQDGLCNLRCPDFRTSHCGGNYFYTVYCNPPKTTNSLEKGIDHCGVPRKRPIKHNVISPIRDELVEAVQQCTQVAIVSADILLNSDAIPAFTYLSENSPANCLTYCTDFLETNSEKLYAGQLYALLGEISESIIRSNCYCYAPTASYEYLPEAGNSNCQYCSRHNSYFCGGERTREFSFVSVYSLETSVPIRLAKLSEDILSLESLPAESTSSPPINLTAMVNQDNLTTQPVTELATTPLSFSVLTTETLSANPPTATREPTTTTSEPPKSAFNPWNSDSTNPTAEPLNITGKPSDTTVEPPTSSSKPMNTTLQLLNAGVISPSTLVEPPIGSSIKPLTTILSAANSTGLSITATQPLNPNTITLTNATEIIGPSSSPPPTATSTKVQVKSTTSAYTLSTSSKRTSTTTPNPRCPKCTKIYNNVDWSACVNEIAERNCPHGIGKAIWKCSKNGFVGQTPNFQNCNSSWLKDINICENKTLVEEEVMDYLKRIEDNMKDASFYGHEIPQILSLGRQLLIQLDQNVTISVAENFTDRVVAVFGNVLANAETWQQLNNMTLYNTSTQYILNLEASTLALASRITKTASFVEEGRSYDRAFNSQTGIQIETRSRLVSSENSELIFPSKYSTKDSSHIRLPSNWHTYFGAYQNIAFVGVQIHPKYVNSLFPKSMNSLQSLAKNNGDDEKIINGDLMSFTFGKSDEAGRILATAVNFSRGPGVSITFQHDVTAWGSEVKKVRRKLHNGERPKAVLGSSICVYWHPTKFEWSSEGCKLIETQESVTECECNHLTAFAVLFDVHQYVGKDIGLEILTWILCPLSVICLAIAITVLANTSVKAFRSPKNELTIHLCACLLISTTLTLIFMDRHYVHLSEAVCTAFAIMTHYFYLCAFSFMVLEGYILYKMVFVVYEDGNGLRLMYLIAYGVPAIIVATTGIISVIVSGDAYATDEFCWLEGNYIWGFLGPVAFVVVGNTTVLFMTLLKAHDLVHNPKVEGSRHRKSCLSWVKGSFSLSILLGTTWAFGYLMLFNDYTLSNLAAYLFTIFNASQGIFLFTFHVLMNKKIQKAIRRRLRLPGMKTRKSSGTATGTGTGSSSRKRATNSSRVNSSSRKVSLTFGSSLTRNKRKIMQYFEKDPVDDHDNMPELTTNKAQRKVNLSSTVGTSPV